VNNKRRQRGDLPCAAPASPVRAAQYVRMSTDHQQYSTENQADAIRQYAEKHGFEIVRTYADEGKSGLNLDGRKALQLLLDDVENGRADFSVVLVYDISRWGRFQNPDEGAYYEACCNIAKIKVHYCAEQFENDGSPVSHIVKALKRMMAGEYCRELSVKVFAGQRRLITMGYRQGGPAGFGLRRQLIDHTGAAKNELGRGEQKSIHTDRVVLVPGPSDEIEVVRLIYSTFVTDSRSEREIAARLNARDISTDLGRPWTRGTVHQVLINEKYVGNNVWNRRSFKLKQTRVRNAPDDWVRADGVFAPIVERGLFDRAQAIIRARSQRFTDQEMLAILQELLGRHGFLSGIVIDEAENGPSSSAYQSRFGSLLRAYELVGFTPDRDFRYIEVNRVLRQLHPQVITETIAGIEQVGGRVVQDPITEILTINDEFSASIVVVRCRETPAGTLRWHIRLDASHRPDVTVAVRMDRSNRQAHDYYILPHLDRSAPKLRLGEYNGIALDAFRFDSLDPLFYMASRVPILEVA